MDTRSKTNKHIIPEAACPRRVLYSNETGESIIGVGFFLVWLPPWECDWQNNRMWINATPSGAGGCTFESILRESSCCLTCVCVCVCVRGGNKPPPALTQLLNCQMHIWLISIIRRTLANTACRVWALSKQQQTTGQLASQIDAMLSNKTAPHEWE